MIWFSQLFAYPWHIQWKCYELSINQLLLTINRRRGSEIQKFESSMLEKHEKSIWTDHCAVAFEQMKTALTEAFLCLPILRKISFLYMYASFEIVATILCLVGQIQKSGGVQIIWNDLAKNTVLHPVMNTLVSMTICTMNLP